MLPNHSTIKAEFGSHKSGPRVHKEHSIAQESALYDVLNLISVIPRLTLTQREKDLKNRHLEYLQPNDFLLMDRGYSSKALFFKAMERSLHCCASMKEDWWLELKAFKESGKKEALFSFNLLVKGRKQLDDFPEYQDQIIQWRSLRIVLESGDIEVLCTSLADLEKYPYEDFLELYH